MGLRLGVGGGSGEIIYSSPSIRKKSLDSVDFVNFADAPQGEGVGRVPPPPIGEPWFKVIHHF